MALTQALRRESFFIPECFYQKCSDFDYGSRHMDSTNIATTM